jgi:O-glycosyl hydrolase
MALLTPGITAAATTVTIEYDQTYQKIDGFGASDAWSINPTVKKWLREGEEAQVEALADQLFSVENGIGLSAWRFNIGAGSSEQGENSAIPDPYRRAELLIPAPGAPVDTQKQSGQIRFLQEAHERGVSNFIAFANSPPAWATKNTLAHPGTGEEIGSTNLAADKVDEFSRFLVDVLKYLRGERVNVPVNYISPANEPTWHWQDQTQEGNRYNNEDPKRLYRSLDRALEDAGLDDAVEIDGAEVPEYRAALSDKLHSRFSGSPYEAGMNETDFGSFRNYIDAFLGDRELREILGNKLSLHAYFSDESRDSLGPLRDLLKENVLEVSPNARLWMSEYCVLGDSGDIRTFEGPGYDVNDMGVALHIGRIIHRDLTRLSVSAWFWWLALTPYDYKDGLLKIDEDLEISSLETSKIMWVLGHYSRFVRPGYQRVELPGNDDLLGLMASAYRNAEGTELVVVATNASDRASELRFSFRGLPPGVIAGAPKVFVTSASANHRETTGGPAFTMGPKSMATLVFPLQRAR